MSEDFLKYQAQTTPHPLAMEISHAEGSYIYDTNNKAYLDFVAGVSACSLGHKHPKVVQAIQRSIRQISTRHGVWRIRAVTSRGIGKIIIQTLT